LKEKGFCQEILTNTQYSKSKKIDLQERDRLIFLLQTQFYKQQEKDWEQMQKKYVNPIAK
jgi:hypothetical protein